MSELPLSILVVDDQHDAADAVAALLSTMGHDVRTAYGPHEALQLFREYRPRVVLMDINMPDMSGYETAAYMRLLPDGTATTIVALTGFGDDEVRRSQSHEASMDYYLAKPAGPEELSEVLRKVPTF
jgi:CheY-like chemotaxis protein